MSRSHGIARWLVQRISAYWWVGHLGVPLPLARPVSRAIDGLDVDFALKSRIHSQDIASDLVGVELGGWALSAAGINYVARVATTLSPQVAIEFGSGASTIALARTMPGGRILSIDQDEYYAHQTRERLSVAGLDEIAEVCTIPVVEWLIKDSHHITDYVLSKTRERSVDLLLVDGPAGPPGIRAGILPAVLPVLASDAVVILDDALRPPDLEYIEQWLGLGFTPRHIRTIGKGMLCLKRTPA